MAAPGAGFGPLGAKDARGLPQLAGGGVEVALEPGVLDGVGVGIVVVE
jgi:hypothetical protein